MKPTWRLAWRFLVADRRRTVFLAASIVAAVTTVGTIDTLGNAATSGAQQATTERFGSATVWLGDRQWIGSDSVQEVRVVLRSDSTTVSPWIELDAFLTTGNGFRVVRAVGSNTARDIEISGDRAGTDLVVIAGPGSAGFVSLNGAGIRWAPDGRHSDLYLVDSGALLVHLGKLGLIAADVVATALRLDGTQTAGVVAFNSAELLDGIYSGVEVRSSDSIGWRVDRISAENVSSAVATVILVAALAAIVGTVLVSLEVRRPEIAILIAMGYGVPFLRTTFTREVFIVSVVGSVAGIALAAVIGGAIAGAQPDAGSMFRLLAVCVTVPGVTAFLAVRRTLGNRLPDLVAEFRR